LAWWARFAAAAAVLALLEVLLIALVFVGGVSSGLSALLLWAMVSGLLGIFGTPLAMLAALLDRERVRRWLPSAPSLLAALLLAAASLLLLRGIDAVLYLEEPEFPREPERMRAVARLAALVGLFALHSGLNQRLRRLYRRLPVALQAWGLPLLGMAAALLALLTAHFAFAPVHEVGATAVVALVALVLLASSMRARAWPVRSSEMKAIVIAGSVLGLLGAALPLAARDGAKFVLWGHSSVAGLAQALRGLLDRDHDAVLPSWLFGAGDCAPGNGAVSPLQLEVPGDGVDQDCRGGDAAPLAPLGAVALPAGCSGLLARPDVLVIAVDALRADALRPEVMPALSELAAHALTFERAYSPTAMTVTSVSAILSGRVFADVGPKNALLDENLTPAVTLAERFQRAGYRTAAFSDFFQEPVFRRGFQQVNPYWRDQPRRSVKGRLTSAAMSRGIVDFLQDAPGPALVWAHASDTHAHYSLDRDAQGKPLSDEAAYYGGAAYVDQQLGRLFGSLQQQGRMQRTIIAVLADHGEELLARGREGHGPNLFEESVHVPLVLWVPGCAARRITQPVGLAHLAPTLGALAGVPLEGVGLWSDDQLPTVVEGVTGLNTTYKRAVIVGRYKLLLDVSNGGRMLFDLESDPQELTDILADTPEVVAKLERAYQRWLDAPDHR
jgi:hypothetical protein